MWLWRRLRREPDMYRLGRFRRVTFPILTALDNGATNGIEIVDVLEYAGDRIVPGTLYAALALLEKRGWIEALPRIEERRQPYQITQAGRDILRMYKARQMAKN